MEPSVSPVANLREHNIFSLNFLNVYLLMLEGEMLPGYKAPALIHRMDVRLLLNKLEALAEHQIPALNEKEQKTLVASYSLMNKLLACEHAEYLSGMITQQMPEGHALKSNPVFRQTMHVNNEWLMNVQIADEAQTVAGIKEWIEQLQSSVLY